MSQSLICSSQMNIGCPHFKGEYRKYKQSDYNLSSSLYELLDNVVQKIDNINIELDEQMM